MLRAWGTWFTVGVAWILAPAPLAARGQPAGQLAGVVRDVTGAAVSGVSVNLTGAALPVPRTVVTDIGGRYEFDGLVPGQYRIDATHSAFEAHTAEVAIEIGRTTHDITLALPSYFEHLTVTATKTGAADVQQTAVAVTALPDRTLEELGVNTIAGLAGFTPSMIVSQPLGLAEVTIRGIGSNTVITGADPSCTVHLDGVYLGRPAMALADLLDVDRVEVLRGPQGTLYGRNSVGGTINIVTRQPTNVLETSVRLTAANYGTLAAEGAIRGPIVKDRVMGSFAFLRAVRDGFVHDLDHPDHPLGGEDTWEGRGQLRAVFKPGSELLLSGDFGRFDGIPLAEAKPIASRPGFSFDNPPRLWDVRASDLASGWNHQQGMSALLTLPMARGTTLKTLTAYRRSNDRIFIDMDTTELSLQTLDVPDLQHQFSEEVTLSRQTPRAAWVGGIHFFDERVEGPVLITLLAPGLQLRPHAIMDTSAWALFGETTYQISNRVSVTGGLRYSDERKGIDNTGGLYVLGTPILAVPESFYDFTDSVNYNAWTPKVSIQSTLSGNLLVYVSASRGFKSGGFNASTPEPGHAFRPELAWSYEGGLKQTAAGGRLHVNAAVFYTDYHDLQVQSFIRSGLLDISNAASATIKGVELEASGSRKGLQLAGHISWLDATYDRYTAVGIDNVTSDAAGHRLNNAPAWSGSASASYQFASGRAGFASVRGDVSSQSRVFFTPLNDSIETQGGYALLHLRAGFEPRSRRWEVAVYLRNLGNTAYITATSNAPLPAVSARPGDPRQWGTQFTLHP